jgi:hypothetical protein
MNYEKKYNELIEQAKLRVTTEQTERHHIIPDCFFINRKRNGEPGWLSGDPDATSNIVELTLREHFVAHLLLAKIYGGKMIYAANVMSNSGKYTSRVYKWIRIAQAMEISKALSGRKKPDGFGEIVSQNYKKRVEDGWKNPQIGVPKSEEHKQKMRNNNLGKILSDETKLKISNSISGEKNGMYGKTHTTETIEIIKEKLKEQITCPHCDKSGGMTIMKRWHFDNCKLSPSYVPPPKMKRVAPSEDTLQKRKKKFQETMNSDDYIHPNKNREMKKDCICIHCGAVAGQGQITRWHNDNCKKRLHQS